MGENFTCMTRFFTALPRGPPCSGFGDLGVQEYGMLCEGRATKAAPKHHKHVAVAPVLLVRPTSNTVNIPAISTSSGVDLCFRLWHALSCGVFILMPGVQSNLFSDCMDGQPSITGVCWRVTVFAMINAWDRLRLQVFPIALSSVFHLPLSTALEYKLSILSTTDLLSWSFW